MKRTKKIPEETKQKLRSKFFPKVELSFDVWLIVDHILNIHSVFVKNDDKINVNV